jgi:hypothetical protein
MILNPTRKEVQREDDPVAATTKKARRTMPSSDGGGEDEEEEMESDFEDECAAKGASETPKQLGEAIGGRGIAQRPRDNGSSAKI